LTCVLQGKENFLKKVFLPLHPFLSKTFRVRLFAFGRGLFVLDFPVIIRLDFSGFVLTHHYPPVFRESLPASTARIHGYLQKTCDIIIPQPENVCDSCRGISFLGERGSRAADTETCSGILYG